MAKELTDEEIHEVFSEFDHDGSGTLSMKELGDALGLLGYDLTPAELTETYRIDDDPDTLNEEEFRAYIRDRLSDVDCEKRCIECFREFDEDSTGSISREKMKEILTQKGDTPLDDETAEHLLDEFDLNTDGRYDIEEFVRLMYEKHTIVEEEY